MKIVITESEDFSLEVINKLKQIGQVFLYNTKSREELIQNISGAHLIFIRLRFKIDKEIIDSVPELRYILTATTGLDHVDLDYFTAKGGRVISLRGETDFLNTIPSTAEHTWGLLLALMRNIPNSFNDVKQGFWRRDLFKGNNLSGKKIGILGLGRVGAQVANFAKAFNMRIGFYDLVPKYENDYIKFNTPTELFKWADIISVHLPLNQTTHHFINSKLLDALAPSAILINTSRGAIVDEAYLASKIENHAIKGYASDVIENEFENNLTKNKLVALASNGFHVLITPHIAGATYESMHMTENFIYNKFLDSYKKTNIK